MPVTAEDLTPALRTICSPLDAVVEILCSQTKQAGYLFAVVVVKSGAVCAVWEAHAAAFESEAQLLAADRDKGLNAHEKTLYALKVHAG